MNHTIAYVAGFFTPPALLLLGYFGSRLARWWKLDPPQRVARWRSWRIKRLRAKAESISRRMHLAD